MSTHQSLHATAAALVAPGKGILAVDESVATISQRFTALGIESTEETRRSYREMLLGAPGIEASISGAILYDETFRQSARQGTAFPDLLSARGILPGIKVDTGAKPLAGAVGETVTEGLDGLRDRVAEYRHLGARFAKWRAVIAINREAGLPTRGCIVANAHALARYAALCQEGGLVPVVEPEVFIDGDHDLARCAQVTREVLTEVFAQLGLAGADLAAVVLKPSMVVPGTWGPTASIDDVATATVGVLRDCVPADVPGVAFLSGGQASAVATAHLNAMARLGPHPWQLTFSYGRALQDEPLRAWAGSHVDVDQARALLAERVHANSAATFGRYDDPLGSARSA